MTEQNDTEYSEDAELFLAIEEVTAKIRQKMAALLAHSEVPQIFKARLQDLEKESI